MKRAVLSLLTAATFALSLSAQAALLGQNLGAAPILNCGLSCGWSIAVDGTEVGHGLYSSDTQGALSGSSRRFGLGSGAWVQLNGLSGNIDPILGFSASANTGNSGMTFSFTFTLPIALEGPILASSSVNYTLSSLSSAGAQITPLFGKTVIAQEVDTSVGGLPPLNKGVDVGDTFGFTGGPKTIHSQIYASTNTFTGNLMYDLMSVNVSFALSPNSSVGMSGMVQQDVDAGGGVGAVPLPGALWLLASGLAGFGVVTRRFKRTGGIET